MPDYRIKSVHAVQVQSRRHNMAVSARVETMDGAVGKALCYAGVSVGTHEVHFQYDGGNRWGGLGCMSAVRNVNTIIADTILGMDVRNQFEIDQYNEATGEYTLSRVGNEQKTALNTEGAATGDRRIFIQAYLDYKRKFGVHDVNAMLLYNQDQLDNNKPDNLLSSLPRRKQGIAARLSYASVSYTHLTLPTNSRV